MLEYLDKDMEVFTKLFKIGNDPLPKEEMVFC